MRPWPAGGGARRLPSPMKARTGPSGPVEPRRRQCLSSLIPASSCFGNVAVGAARKSCSQASNRGELRAHLQWTLAASACCGFACGPAVRPALTGVFQPSAATASATICSTPDGSVASAAASAVQPPASATASTRRSRASITATSTSSRCTPNGGLRRRLTCAGGVCACVRACGGQAVRAPAHARISLASRCT